MCWVILDDYIVRTQKTLIVPNEKGAEGANSINGASSGIVLLRLALDGFRVGSFV